MHTIHSDGTGTHQDIADAALSTGLDVVIVTDHNVFIGDMEGYYGEDGQKKVLMLIGEEVHDQTREPQKNHLLVFGAEKQMSDHASTPQGLIDAVNNEGGLSFLAHPIDVDAPLFGETDISWVDWEVKNYTGIELWNGLAEMKSLLTNYYKAAFYGLNFAHVGHGPYEEMLKKWDSLLALGIPVVAVGGSDAHNLRGNLGPIKRWIYPYDKHFKAVNTHVLIPDALSGDIAEDKKMIFDALRSGHCFIGYDLPKSTIGFKFSAHLNKGTASMGDMVSLKDGVTLQIKLPAPSELRLIKDGEVIQSSFKRDNIIFKVQEKGVYRVEAYRKFKGKRRGWIFSNPIYVQE